MDIRKERDRIESQIDHVYGKPVACNEPYNKALELIDDRLTKLCSGENAQSISSEWCIDQRKKLDATHAWLVIACNPRASSLHLISRSK